MSDIKNFRSLIILWSFAESGIGGILHALRLPFTGILVGGVAVICIALIAFFAENKRAEILEALGIVLAVKLMVSPHSPWQAYVAVAFQGYMGWLLLNDNRHFTWRVLVFSTICLMESALQKILLALLIYGVNFMEAFDATALAVLKSVGWVANGSVVMWIFGIYILFHLITGLALGFWIPVIPRQMKDFAEKIPAEVFQISVEQVKWSKKWITGITGIILLIIVLTAIKIILPGTETLFLLLIFLRSVGVSLLLIFVVGPIIKHYLTRQAAGKYYRSSVLKEVVDEIPGFARQASGMANWVNGEYRGLKKVKYLILGLLILSCNTGQIIEKQIIQD